MGKAIEKALAYIQTEQQENGSFISLSSPAATDFQQAFVQHSIFLPAWILSCLTTSPDPRAAEISKQIASFLLTQRSEYWSFNYWERGSSEASEKPYPDDLDDTFCALAALTPYDPKLVDASALAHIVTLLTSVEQAEGGPYRTWLVPPTAEKHWQDIDLAVNSNIAYFLSLQDIQLPNLVQLVEEAIEREAYVSPYYPSPYPVLYFIARFYRGGKKDKIKKYLKKHQNEDCTWGDPLSTALAISSLLNLGCTAEDVSESIAKLESWQAPDGSWSAQAFCLDPAINRQPYYAGSAALTTAFCLEAIMKYENAAGPLPQHTKQLPSADEQHVTHIVQERIRARFAQLDPPLQQVAESELTKLLHQDKAGQITRLSYYMRQALGTAGQEIPDELVLTLGQINAYGWMAYTIYDDFLDEEGTPQLLPAATLCLREVARLLSHLTAIPHGQAIESLGHQLLDTIDAANAWEAEHCRRSLSDIAARGAACLPNFGNMTQLAHKSMGHALGPAALLVHLGYNPQSPEVRHLLAAFEHYIIARQLNDDAHDWLEDLQRGQINAVAALTLQGYRMTHDASTLLDEYAHVQLQEFFWLDVAESVCNRVLHHSEKARELLHSIAAFEQPESITRFFDATKAVAEQTLRERQQALDFIQAYRQRAG